MKHHNHLKPYLVPAPGEILADELKARNCSQTLFASIIGRPTQFISELVHAKRSITPETALQLEAALGIPARSWLELESKYRVWIAEHSAKKESLREIKERAVQANLLNRAG